MRLSIFISSVQKEFTEERRAVKDFILHDSLLRRFFQDVFLFEDLPAQGRMPEDIYLEEVERCDIYLGLFGCQYGQKNADGFSATELEFDRATAKRKERLIYVKGVDDSRRVPEMQSLIRKAGSQLTRRRFTDISNLQREVYASLVDYLERHGALRTSPFDATICPGAGARDVDPVRIDTFLDMAEKQGRLKLQGGRSVRSVLKNFNLGSADKPTNAAILLFGCDPARLLNVCQLQCLHFHGTEKHKPIPSQQVYEGTAFEVIDKAQDFVLGILARQVGTLANSSTVPISYEIPSSVIREAIVNAVAHRNYDRGFVQVIVFADRVEVWSPGELTAGFTPETLREPHGPLPVNPLIAEPLFRAGYAQKAGTGTTDMIADCRAAGLAEPSFEQHGPHFVVTLWRDWLTQEVMTELGLNDRQRAALMDAKMSGGISNSRYREITRISDSTALRELRQICKLGVLDKVGGTGRSAHYTLAKVKPVINPSNPSSGITTKTPHKAVKPVKGHSNN